MTSLRYCPHRRCPELRIQLVSRIELKHSDKFCENNDEITILLPERKKAISDHCWKFTQEDLPTTSSVSMANNVELKLANQTTRNQTRTVFHSQMLPLSARRQLSERLMKLSQMLPPPVTIILDWTNPQCLLQKIGTMETHEVSKLKFKNQTN